MTDENMIERFSNKKETFKTQRLFQIFSWYVLYFTTTHSIVWKGFWWNRTL